MRSCCISSSNGTNFACNQTQLSVTRQKKKKKVRPEEHTALDKIIWQHSRQSDVVLEERL